jgi:2',3'-cyclic-nucleotide 2'-phosphodiesterase (5'-nucleotidase family)
VFLLGFLACPKPVEPPQEPLQGCVDAHPGAVVVPILHLNDIYRIEGLIDGRGGLARVRTLRRALEADCGQVLVTHAGDALGPSLLSRKLDGEQMIDTLNHLDGGPGHDPLMVMTFGNHEFDQREAEDAAALQAHLEASEFTWLDTNITWSEGVGVEHMTERTHVQIAGVDIGLFALTTDAAVPAYASFDTAYEAVARRQIAALRQEGARFVVALTHLSVDEDRALLQALGAEGPDLLLGGHDHVAIAEQVEGTWLVKSAADAVEVQELKVAFLDEGGHRVFLEAHTLDEGVPRDPTVQARVEHWQAEAEALYCEEAEPGCLDVAYARTTTAWEAEELTIRRYESNLGDYLADLAREHFEADVAVLNSGALRLNQDVPAGSDVTQRLLEELLPYPIQLVELDLTGAQLQAMLDHSVSAWTGSGHWLQVSGIAFTHRVEAGAAEDLHLLSSEGPVRVTADMKLRVVVPRYIVDPAFGDQDGYGATEHGGLSWDLATDHPAQKTGVEQLLLERLSQVEAIAPERDGRICSTDRAELPCFLE